jgi:hypothetical protein
MTTAEQIAKTIPHDIRKKILIVWIPVAMADMNNDAMQLLFEAWFLYVEPNGIKKPDCQLCVNNILAGWHSLKQYLINEERDYDLIEQL